MFLVFLTSGLFLGWSLGANDAANVFGTAVGTKMIRFKKAALIASIFVILGAVIQGEGTTKTLGQLGAVDALPGAFTVALAAAITVFVMTKYKLPVSTTQAIVGAIVGWNLFTGHETNYAVLSNIVGTWFSGPILGAVFSALLYLLFRWFLKKQKIHLVILDSYLKWGLIIVGAFGSYSLGANNIANVMGVFVHSMPALHLDFGIFHLNETQVLFFVGGLAIAAGIFMYGRKVMETVGDGLLSLNAEGAIVVVLAQSVVLFVFSSQTLSDIIYSVGLPRIPQVPVSSSQVIVGCVIGIGLIKGVQELKFRVLGEIMLGWIATPLASGLLAFFSLFFIKNLFGLPVTLTTTGILPEHEVKPAEPFYMDVIFPGVIFLLILIIGILIYYSNYQQKKRFETERSLFARSKEHYTAQQALVNANLKTMHLENQSLSTKLEFKQKELMFYALNIGATREYLNYIFEQLSYINEIPDSNEKTKYIAELIQDVKEKMNLTNEVEDFYYMVDHIQEKFQKKLKEQYPQLSKKEIRLAELMRMGFTEKEICSLLNQTNKTMEMNFYSLRKKLNIPKETDLLHFIKSL